MTIVIGIDVAKDKHDCFICNSEGEVLSEAFTIENNQKGFDFLLKQIQLCNPNHDKLKIGLEATGHYSYNIIGFLQNNDLPLYVLNPLQVNLYRKGRSLRKTKTDKLDARAIAELLLSNTELKPYSALSYHMEDLKSLCRYRFTLVQTRSRYKISISRLICIVFPELDKYVSKLHSKHIYAMLSELPGAHYIAEANLTHLKSILRKAAPHADITVKAEDIRSLARGSIAPKDKARALELQYTISMINLLDKQISDIETEIESIMKEIKSPISTIPGIGPVLSSMIIAEVGNFKKFNNPNKLLAFSGLSPSIYQSGKIKNVYPHMDKRGSKYLRYALFNAAARVCALEPNFKKYLAKKRAEGKHYYVAISHAAKKLVRLMFALEKSHKAYVPIN